MAFDLKRGFFNDLREWPVAAGASITEEGQLLALVDAGDGTAAVSPTNGTAQNVIGFAITDALKYVTQTVVEEVVVPVGGGTVSLAHSNIVASSALAVGSTTSSLTETYDVGTAASGVVDFATVAGTALFNTAQAGETVTIQYRYTPTLAEVLATEHQRSINNTAQDYFSSVGVAGLDGEIFTTVYDTAAAYTVGAKVYAGAAGKLTSASTSTVVVGVVTQVPGVADGRLGVKFRMPV